MSFTLEEDTEKATCILYSDKYIDPFHLSPAKGKPSGLFEFRCHKGDTVPEALQGHFSSIRAALKHFTAFEAQAKQTPAKRTQSTYIDQKATRERRKLHATGATAKGN